MENEGKNRFEYFVQNLTQESFSEFFGYYFTRLVQFATFISKSELLAEEIVLDVFTRLWVQRENLGAVENIETYLFVAVRNTALNVLKKETRFSFDMLDNSHVQLVDYKLLPEDVLIESEMLQALNQAVAMLPAKCKVIFKLIREDGLNRNEVAQILDISVKTVDNQISIAVKRIAEQLNIDLSVPRTSLRLTSFLLCL